MKKISVALTYKYANSSSEHRGEVVFDSSDLTEESFKDLQSRMRDGFYSKSRDSFIPSQVNIPDLFDYVPSFENDTCWHKYTGCDISLKNPTDERTFEEFVTDVEVVTSSGWEKFDVLERKTGRISKKKYQKEIETLSRNYTKEIEQINKANTKEIDRLTKLHAKEIEIALKNSEKEISQIGKNYDKEIEKIKKSYTKDKEMVETRHEKSKSLLLETSECIENYFEGEATSEELEKIGKDVKKILSSI